MTDQPSEHEKADAAATSSDESDAAAYRVSLPMFEGPLDLLLHLIQKHELDILDIPIAFVAKKYVEYIGMMEVLSIDIASEYLVMAATLAHIKSRSLLPPDPTQEAEDDVLEEDEDPRTELIRRLLEYQKYKHAADTLGERELLGRDVFARGLATEPTAEEAPLAPLSLFKLIDAFESVLKRAKQVEEHQINFERISISERIGQIVDRLRARGTLRFEQLFDGDVSRADMIVTFLALLEMTKLRLTRLTQTGPLEPIVVELAVAPGERHEFETDQPDEDRRPHDADWGNAEAQGIRVEPSELVSDDNVMGQDVAAEDDKLDEDAVEDVEADADIEVPEARALTQGKVGVYQHVSQVASLAGPDTVPLAEPEATRDEDARALDPSTEQASSDAVRGDEGRSSDDGETCERGPAREVVADVSAHEALRPSAVNESAVEASSPPQDGAEGSPLSSEEDRPLSVD